MSGIIGILHLDDAPVDRQLLERLTNSLAFRGPDAQQTWCDGAVGFGHTLCRTTDTSEHESQPFSIDGQVWIVADARIDAQRDLLAALRAAGQQPPAGATDAELVLRAYLAWGQDCVEHLLGDFAFAIWDAPRRSLFCARDQMGLKPFYYADLGSLVVFSNTLDSIRLHPAVSGRLNDLAIADFLLCGCNQEKSTTAFADVQRLAPAHRVTWSPEGRRISRYWTMPIDEPLFYRRASDYTDRFQELLRDAVSDRLRTNRIGIFMSGGIDSTTLTAATRDALQARGPGFDLLAVTDVAASLPEERDYATLAARHLAIPIKFRESSHEAIAPGWERTPFRSPEPHPFAYGIPPEREKWRAAAVSRRVFFWGEGPDNALQQEWPPYLSYLLRTRRYGSLLSGLLAAMIADQRPLFWGRAVRRLQRWRGTYYTPPVPSFPDWLDPEFESRLDLRSRWRQIQRPAASAHPLRPRGYASLQIPLWQMMFEEHDAGATGVCVEVRQPYTDLRMLRFLLAVPALPWCRSKYLIRRAMRDTLPPAILKRKKTPLPSDQIAPGLGLQIDREPFQPAPELGNWLNPGLIPHETGDELTTYDKIRIHSLNHWLKFSWKLSHNAPQEGSHELIGKTASGRQEAL